MGVGGRAGECASLELLYPLILIICTKRFEIECADKFCHFLTFCIFLFFKSFLSHFCPKQFLRATFSSQQTTKNSQIRMTAELEDTVYWLLSIILAI